jgi:hypothetical protein
MESPSRQQKSTRLSESESSSSWENKQFPSASNLNLIPNFGNNSILLKTPERRLKLTIRVKRSPASSNTCSSFDQNFGLDEKSNNKCDDNEPEYEILRTEGIDGISENESTSTLIFTGIKRSKRKKRHKHKKNKCKRSKKYSSTSDDFSNFSEQTCNNSSEASSSHFDEAEEDKPQNYTRAKRVKLMFGNEMKILNIPDKSSSTESDLKSNTSLMPVKCWDY